MTPGAVSTDVCFRFGPPGERTQSLSRWADHYIATGGLNAPCCSHALETMRDGGGRGGGGGVANAQLVIFFV